MCAGKRNEKQSLKGKATAKVCEQKQNKRYALSKDKCMKSWIKI